MNIKDDKQIIISKKNSLLKNLVIPDEEAKKIQSSKSSTPRSTPIKKNIFKSFTSS